MTRGVRIEVGGIKPSRKLGGRRCRICEWVRRGTGVAWRGDMVTWWYRGGYEGDEVREWFFGNVSFGYYVFYLVGRGEVVVVGQRTSKYIWPKGV